jgi:hypothetical protein
VLTRLSILIVLVGCALIGEWIYLAVDGSYFDCSGENCGSAWGFLQALWVALIVLFGLLSLTLLVLVGRRLWAHSPKSSSLN